MFLSMGKPGVRIPRMECRGIFPRKTREVCSNPETLLIGMMKAVHLIPKDSDMGSVQQRQTNPPPVGSQKAASSEKSEKHRSGDAE